jgi:hypothetical protein
MGCGVSKEYFDEPLSHPGIVITSDDRPGLPATQRRKTAMSTVNRAKHGSQGHAYGGPGGGRRS